MNPDWTRTRDDAVEAHWSSDRVGITVHSYDDSPYDIYMLTSSLGTGLSLSEAVKVRDNLTAAIELLSKREAV